MSPTLALILIVLIIIIAFLATIFSLWLMINPFFGNVPYVPSSMATVRLMIESARIQEGEKILDIGSGDGRIVVACAQKGAFAYGCEINPLLVAISRLIIRIKGLQKNATIEQKDLYKMDFGEYDVIMTYCLPKTLSDLEEKLYRELRPGGRIVCNTFRFKQWTPVTKNGKVYLYEKPINSNLSENNPGLV